MNNKIKLAFVGLDSFPIPAIRGGAMEAGVTRMMDMNEKFQEMEFFILSKADEGLKEVEKNYKCSKIIQIEPNRIYCFIGYVHRILRKLSGHRLPIKTPYMNVVNRQLIRGDYDIVMFCTSNDYVAQISKKVKSKIVYRVVSDYLTKESYGIETIKDRVDKYYTFNYIKRRMMAMLDLPEDKFWGANNSIDISIPDENTRKEIRRDIRKKLKIEENEIVLIYVGRLSKEKGPLELISAVKQVPNCKLIVVGGENFNSDKQTDYVNELHKEAEECGARVIFTGYLPAPEARKYMYAADVASVPSICNEAASSALLEFRVSMLPTVASNMGGMKDNAGENVLWVEYDVNYIDGLAGAIKRLVDDKALRESLSQVARVGLENRTREYSYKRLLNWCEELLHG